MCCPAKSSAPFEKRDPLRTDLAIRSFPTGQGNRRSLLRLLKKRTLLCPWRYRPLLVSGYEHGNVSRSLWRCQMTSLSKTKRGGLVSASLPALLSLRLDLRQAAVHGHFGAGHERSIRRGQECHCASNLRRLADSLHRHFGHDVPYELVDLFLRQSGARKSLRRFNRARAHGIYANSALGQFRRQRTREGTQRRLRRRVYRTVHQSDFAGHGRIDDDRRAVIQQRQRFLDREIHTFRIDVEELVVQAFGRRRQRRELVNSRIREQHVDFSKFLRNGGVEFVELLRLRDVCPYRNHIFADCFHGFVQRFLVAAGNHNARAFLIESLRRCQSDAAVSPGYNRYFSFESLHDSLPIEFSKSRASRPCRFAALLRFRYLDERLTIRLHVISMGVKRNPQGVLSSGSWIS